jgi:hypothetical protein
MYDSLREEVERRNRENLQREKINQLKRSLLNTEEAERELYRRK